MSSSRRAPVHLIVLVLALALVAVRTARAEGPPTPPVRLGEPVPIVLTPPPTPLVEAQVPVLEPAIDVAPFLGNPITRIEIALDDDAWPPGELPTVTSVHPGQSLDGAVARRIVAEVLASGRYARARVVAQPEGGGVRLVVHLVQRRLVEALRLDVHGAAIDRDELLREAGIAEGGEITGVGLPDVRKRIENHMERRGYPRSSVTITSRPTDDPTRVLLIVDVRPGAPRLLERRAFYVFGEDARVLRPTLEKYAVDVGTRVDEPAIDAADLALAARLHAKGYQRAAVSHDVVLASGIVTLRVRVDSGPLFVPRFVGNQRYDEDALEGALALDTETDLAPGHLVEKLASFYVERGFLDAEVTLETRGGDKDRRVELVFHIDEHARVGVVSRSYPCLKERDLRRLAEAPDTVAGIGTEIDSFLEEELPGADLFRDPDPQGLDRTITTAAGRTGARPVPIDLDPDSTFVGDTYERALAHVQELYRNEGFLHALVGPVRILRRQCDKRSPPGRCIPVPQKPLPADECAYDASNLPLEVPPLDPSFTCIPDAAHGVECEPRMQLRIPIKLGPRTILYDIAFDGVRAIAERDLAGAAALSLGSPVSTVKVEEARRRIVDLYKEEGYAYAEVKSTIETSGDFTRARVRFEVAEGEQVIVRAIEIRGNTLTQGGTIRRRIALEVGKPYRTSDVRKTQERIATLNTFATVSVGLEDPYVPQKNKVVVITVVERLPQYLELRPGFSTGEGFRGALEYNHRNIGGDAISLSFRAQASYLPDELILDPVVRSNFDKAFGANFSGQRIAARVTAGLSFPEIGLGPLVRLGIDGVFVRDLERDFYLTKFAGIPSLIYRPAREFQFTASQSFEHNVVTVFQFESIGAYLLNLGSGANADLRRILRVPDGPSYALAQRFTFTWDRRDAALNAHRGTYSVTGVEHIDWYALEVVCTQPYSNPGSPACPPLGGHTLKLTETVAAYLPVTRNITLAAELRLGTNIQLTHQVKVSPNYATPSTTYPDRLFFLGGVDSMRGYLQDTFVPQELADQIQADASKPSNDPTKLTYQGLAILGGNLMVNPRLELRIPLRSPFATVVFVDAGNLWSDPLYMFDHGLSLRYTAGSGLRIDTPIGPLAFDYGVNLSRLFAPSTDVRKSYEDFGAFHFAIGLF